MIRNIIFDMGGVLLYYEPRALVEREVADPEDAAKVFDACFGSEEWLLLDAGALTEEEALARMQSHVEPRLREKVAHVFAVWPDCLSPVPGMEELVLALQGKGYRCLVLSNASVRFPVLVERYSILSRIDERFVSAFHRLVKPHRAIYERFLELYGLSADECVTFDDLAANVEGALACGIHAHRFEGAADAAAFLRGLGVDV